MKFEPHRFDESLSPNIPHEHPAWEVLRLGAWLLGLLLVAWLLVTGIVHALPHLVSLERERAWFGSAVAEAFSNESRQDARLQALADGLAKDMGLPAGIVKVAISADDTPNAFATFGGQVVLMQGLLDKLPSEEAVAGALAHEIAHIKHRDPLRGVSRSLLLGLIWGTLVGHHGSIEAITSLETLRHSRAQEEAADTAAIDVLALRYQSVGGMQQLMQTLGKVEGGGDADSAAQKPRRAVLGWLSSHPRTADRLKAIQQRAREKGYSLQPPSRPNPWRQS
ncbi:MAG: M48 family metallopeptidase [Lautropia sp.]|nr:M48 family metallopeptidase [Lautropia sp.]